MRFNNKTTLFFVPALTSLALYASALAATAPDLGATASFALLGGSITSVGVATIRRLELTEGIPSSNAQTLNLIKKTFESAGIEFLGNPEDGAGVRFRPQP